MSKVYNVTYKTREGSSIQTCIRANNTGHAIVSVQELIPEALRIIQVLQAPEWP